MIKICGVTSLDVALALKDLNVEMIGFVFARSSRRITVEKAAYIASKLPKQMKKVGVFVNEKKETIERIAHEVGLDYIQLHGDESASFATSLSKPVIKAFTIGDVNDEVLRSYPCHYYLIDSPGTTYRGGSGNVFDWTKLNELNIDRSRLILAGGLRTENVEEAITSIQPAGVDVSSGVETDGKKDLTKIAQFVRTAKNARKIIEAKNR